MASVDADIANGTASFLGGSAGLSAPNVAVLGYLPKSLIFLPTGQLRYKQKFSYSATFQPLAASATASVGTQIQADSDFVWIAASISAFKTDNVTPVALGSMPFLIRIIDTGSGAQIMDGTINVSNYFGQGGAPRVNLGVPYIFRRSSQIQAQLSNQDAANAYNVQIEYIGFKVFDMPAE